MDVVKIKIGTNEYDIKDASVRNWIAGNGDSDFSAQVSNIIKYGVADITGISADKLAEMAINMIKYGVSDTYGYTNDQLLQMMSNMIKYGINNIDGIDLRILTLLEQARMLYLLNEYDPVFINSIASKLIASVDETSGTLNLIGT